MKKTMAIVMAVMLASLLFVFVQALRIHVAFNLPERILQMLPYLLTLAMLIGFGVVALIRMLAAHYKWNLPRIEAEED